MGPKHAIINLVLLQSSIYSLEENLKESKMLSGVLVTLLTLTLLNNGLNAAHATKNNLLSERALTTTLTPTGVFLVSRPSNDVILEKYANSTSLSDSDLVELLKAVGFKGKRLKTAWAVAKAESNGRPLAFNGNVNTGDSSYGVYQINMLQGLGPDRREKFNLDHNVDLLNPVINAKVAFHMTKGGTNWSAWSSYNKGAHYKWLNKFPE
jgi:hypothetical protein